MKNGTPTPAEALARLFEVCGRPGICKSCGVAFYWVTTNHGRRCPFDAATGESHFLTCPDAAKYRGKGKVSDARTDPRGLRGAAGLLQREAWDDTLPDDWLPYGTPERL